MFKTFGLPAGARWRRVYPAAAVSAGVDVSADPNHITGKCNANVPFNLKLSINKQIEECQRKCNRNWNAFQACRPSSAHSKKDETKCRSHRDCHCNLAKFGNKGARWQCTTGTRIQCIQYWAEQQGITSWDCYSSCAAQSDKSDLPSTTSASSQFRTDLTSLLCGRRGLQCRPEWRLEYTKYEVHT